MIHSQFYFVFFFCLQSTVLAGTVPTENSKPTLSYLQTESLLLRFGLTLNTKRIYNITERNIT